MKKPLALIFSLATILRLAFIGIAPAWYDESFTLLVTRLPFDRMLLALSGDVHPPLWYLLLWPLGQLHAPIWILRIPAAIFSLLSLWCFWRILVLLELSPRVRIAALVLMAVMPIQLYYAMEARMYSLLEFLVLLAFWAVLKKKWWLYSLAGALMLYTQYYGVFYLLALFIIATFTELWAGRSRESWRIVLYTWAAGSAFVPWFVLAMLPQMGKLTGTYWMQLTGVGMVLRVLFDDLFMPPQNAVIQIPLMLAGFAWLALAIIYSIRRGGLYARLPIFAMAFLPFIFAILASILWQPVLHYRPLIAITPFLYIILASPINGLFEFPEALSLNDWQDPIWRRILLASCFLLPLLIICDGSIFLNIKSIKTPTVTPELSYIQSHYLPGDIIYHFSDDSWVNSAALTNYELQITTYKSPDCATVLGALSPITRSALGQDIRPLTAIPYTRAWLIWSDSPLDPPCNLAQKPAGAPLLIADDDEYVFEGLWLVEK
jgi:uncharacterized membrane protein